MYRKIAFLFLTVVLLTFIVCSDDDTNLSDYQTYRIFGDVNDPDSERGYMPVWYIDSEYIIFIFRDKDFSNICSIDPEGDNLTYLVKGEEYDPENYGLEVFSTSDDGYILFYIVHGSYCYEIYYFIPGSEPVRTDIIGRSPTIYGNLSGTYNIAYIYKEDPGTLVNSIFLSDINGSPPKKLLDGEGRYSYIHPDWSSDGKKLVYFKRDYLDDNSYLCIYDMEDRKEEILIDSYGSSPRFSPDDRYIAFAKSSDTEGVPQNVIWLIDSSGGEPWQVTEYPYDPNRETPGIYYLSWSPDGKWIVYDMGTEGELWRVRVFE